LSRMPGNWHVRFLREPGTAMCPAYLTIPCNSAIEDPYGSRRVGCFHANCGGRESKRRRAVPER
jgi:hypothetical protein